MLLFWLLAALMTLTALAFVLVPMLRARPPAGPSAREAALEALRGQRREIEADIAAGQLPAEARDEAMAELVDRAHQDLESRAPAAAATAQGKPWALAGAVAVLVPALAFALYAMIGTPSATDAKRLEAGRHPVGDAQIAAMVESLARKVRERPDDAQGWSLLARSMSALGRFAEAAEAYEHLSKLGPPDASLLADWADAAGMAQGRRLQGRPTELALRALELDPKHRKALALAATAALEREDFTAAHALWDRLRAELEPGTPDAQQVASILEEVRGRAAASGRPLAAAKAASRPTASPPSRGDATLTGSVSVAPAIAAQVRGDETLFVYARAEGGPRMPLALVRAPAGALPFTFALDDTQAMAPGATLSSAPAVRIEARISRSGDAMPKPGDLVGTSGVVKPGARDVRVVVDKVLP